MSIIDTQVRRTTRRSTWRLVAGSWPYVLACGSAVAALVASGSALLLPRLLRGAAVTDGNLRGTAAVVVSMGVPVLAVGMLQTRRGDARGLVLWLGASAYLLYQGVLFCFATPINDFFLAYVALLGFSLWATASVLLGVQVERAEAAVSPGMPYRRLAAFLGLVASANGVAWLGRTLSAAVGDHPQSLVAGSGLPTSPVWVQDLAFWIPAAVLVATLTWRRRPIAGMLTGGLLVYYTLECVSVASDQWWGARADSSHPGLASMAVVPGALVLAVLIGTVVVWHLRHVDGAPGQRPRSGD